MEEKDRKLKFNDWHLLAILMLLSVPLWWLAVPDFLPGHAKKDVPKSGDSRYESKSKYTYSDPVTDSSKSQGAPRTTETKVDESRSNSSSQAEFSSGSELGLTRATWVLVAVTYLLVCVAIFQWRKMAEHAKEFGRLAYETRRVANAALDQSRPWFSLQPRFIGDDHEFPFKIGVANTGRVPARIISGGSIWLDERPTGVDAERMIADLFGKFTVGIIAPGREMNIVAVPPIPVSDSEVGTIPHPAVALKSLREQWIAGVTPGRRIVAAFRYKSTDESSETVYRVAGIWMFGIAGFGQDGIPEFWISD